MWIASLCDNDSKSESDHAASGRFGSTSESFWITLISFSLKEPRQKMVKVLAFGTDFHCSMVNESHAHHDLCATSLFPSPAASWWPETFILFSWVYAGKIADGSTPDVTDDLYHKYRDDIAMMKQLGFQHYRMSLSWSRILPGTCIHFSGKKQVENFLLEAFVEENIGKCFGRIWQPFQKICRWLWCCQ